MTVIKDEYETLFTKLNKDEIDNLGNKYYVFIRNYDSVNTNITSSVFHNAIKLVDNKNKTTNIIYTHSTINTVLNDNFLGLSPNDHSNLYIEVIDPKNRTDNMTKRIGFNDVTKSIFSVWYSEISKKDYILLQQILNEHIKHKDKISYSYLNLGKIGINKIVDKILKLFKRDKSNEALEIKEEKLVCSTFVAYILKFLDKFKTKINDYNLYTPTDIVSKLEFTHLVSGKWNEYDDLINDIVKKNPEFEPFLLKLK